MGILKATRVKFFRSTVSKKEKGFRPSRYSSDLDIRSELIDKEGVDISSFQSDYAEKLLWGVAQSDEVSGGYYSVIVAVSRFLAMYALDEKFRQEFTANPQDFAIINAEYSIDPKELYIFTEGDDMKLYPYTGNEQRIKDGHLIAQNLDPATEKIQVVKFEDLIQIMEGILIDTRPDSSMRLIDDLYATAGFDDVSKRTYECVLQEDDGETRKWRRVIDALNIAFTECKNKVTETGSKITESQLIDVTARGIASFLSLTRFTPTLVELDQYRYEMRTKEIDLPNIMPEAETGNEHIDEPRSETGTVRIA